MSTVTTNHHRRPLLMLVELTASERAEFDYVKRDDALSPRFVRAYGSVHDVSDVQRITVSPRHDAFGYNVTEDSDLATWHGIATDSAFSGHVFRWTTDASGDDAVVVGFAYSA